MRIKYNHLATGVMLTIGLAGCGQHHDKANMTVSDMVNDPKLLTVETNWCGQQPNPAMIQGCENYRMAEWVMQNPKLLAMTSGTEPWPNKDATFFASSASASMIQYNKDHGFYFATKDNEAIIASIPANAINAYTEEINWCGIQAAYKSNEAPSDFSEAGPIFHAEVIGKVSKTCNIVSNIHPLAKGQQVISR